jgi:carbon monoxide dehydrogenase subunit G
MSKVSVQLDNDLELAADRDRVWAMVTAVPQVIPCIPGGRLLETVDDSTWKAEVALDLGFTRVVFLADVKRKELDEANSRAMLEIDAVDRKGKSTAHAEMQSTLSSDGDLTMVKVETAVEMEGEVARFGSGIIEDVSYEIVDQMTKCLQERLAQPGVAGETAPPPPAAGKKLSLWGAVMLWIRGRRRRRQAQRRP